MKTEFLDLPQEEDVIATQLSACAAQFPEIFRAGSVPESSNPAFSRLEETLLGQGISPKAVLQLMLILHQPDFYYLRGSHSDGQPKRLTAAELSIAANRLHSATGLQMTAVYAGLYRLCTAAGLLFTELNPEDFSGIGEANDAYMSNTEQIPHLGSILSPEAYRKCAADWEQLWTQKAYAELIEKTAPYCAAGMPTACYFAGACALYGLGREADLEQAASLLQTAAQGGELRAYNALGDYYAAGAYHEPNRKELAYRYLTAFGAEPLSQKQRELVENLRKDRLENQKAILKLGILLGVLLTCFVAGNILCGTGGVLWAGILALLLDVGVLAAAVYGQKKHPFFGAAQLAFVVSWLIWAAYLLLWLSRLMG